ncbi:MAG: hypothetical protein ACD_62C00527G0003 [uncultured bacterium]|nr:MAG: hypothetical protein ACD_62C00527G0003 [uncultured bacterium]
MIGALNSNCFGVGCFSLEKLTESQTEGSDNDLARTPDADHAGAGNPANAHQTDIVFKDLFKGHGRNVQRQAIGTEYHRQTHVMTKMGHERDHDEPGQQRTQCDDEGIMQTDDVTQTEHRGEHVDFENQFEFGQEGIHIGNRVGRDGFGKSLGVQLQKIVNAADNGRSHEYFGLCATRFTRHQNFGCGSGLRKRVLAMHFFDEITAKRNQQQHAQHAT